MTLYRRRPTAVEAYKWQPDHETMDGRVPLPEWLNKNAIVNGRTLELWSAEGITRVYPNEWVVQEANGKLKSYTDELFHLGFEVMHD